MRDLGKNQEACLRALKENNGWYAGCGWIWGNPSTTERLLDSLVKRGLATKETKQRRWMAANREYVTDYSYYKPVKDA